MPPGTTELNTHVAPHAGAWIETLNKERYMCARQVAPHAGAWIETLFAGSVPENDQVAPHAGAWIETPRIKAVDSSASCRPSRRGVD